MTEAEIEAQEARREATATIRGYLYQFDAGILKILAAERGDQVTVEGVEDVDLSSPVADTYAQVKYYAAQKLTDARLRDAILPMIRGFLRYKASERARKNYVLYGHFDQAPNTPPTTTLEDLQRILVEQPLVGTAAGGKTRAILKLQQGLGASDSDLEDFGRRLKIELTPAFEVHREQVIEALRSALQVSRREAEFYLYPSAQSAMAQLSVGSTRSDRTTTRANFLQGVRQDIAIYSAWALREESESAYCRGLRERHFAQLNVESRDRFFVLTLPDSDSGSDLQTLVQHIVSRWSSHRLNSKPDRERYAPVFLIPSLPQAALAALKRALFHDGHTLTDGHPFLGADFDVRQLMEPQTRNRPISARFVSDRQQFETALQAASQGRGRLVIQLHAADPIPIPAGIEHIAIPITNANMAKKIV